MTVSYNLDLSNASLISFVKLQLRWRGSIWKCVFKELLMFSIFFAALTVTYRSDYILTNKQRILWDDFAALFDQKLDYIPLTFMLGFFVTIIVGRWNDIFLNMGWIDNIALATATYMRGSDEKSRVLRRNIIRYMVLTQVLLLRDVSMQVRRRFPSLETIVASGFMLECELTKYNECSQKFSKYFLPVQWCFTLLYEARQSGKIACDLMLNEIIKHITDFRKGLAQISNFDWVPIPLVYPQVVFLAVRSYFFVSLIARQSILIDGEKPKHDSLLLPFIPFIMTALQFIFYVGWMKVAESLMNPLGEDDDDFELNFLVDRNLSVGLTIVDDNFNEAPSQQKDIFWSRESIEPLYSADAAVKPVNPQIGSASQYEPQEDEIMMMKHVNAEDGIGDDFSLNDNNIEGNNLLQRGVSIVSVNRQCGSRTSLGSRTKTGILDTLKRQFSRDGRKLSRPTRLTNSQFSLNNELKPSFEVTSESSTDILREIADESSRNHTLLTPEGDLISPSRRPSPVNDVILTSVPEEDEESQRTRTSHDLHKWKKMMDNKKN
ncbi:unnamed protein product [Auanema sp. JU1783]|nr:unnamed protein product [Auanema sp. JU1783]